MCENNCKPQKQYQPKQSCAQCNACACNQQTYYVTSPKTYRVVRILSDSSCIEIGRKPNKSGLIDGLQLAFIFVTFSAFFICCARGYESFQ